MAASAPPVFTAQAHPDPVQTEFLPLLDEAATYHPQPIIMVPQAPDFNYKPSDYMNLSLVIAVLFGILSPLTLFLTIPAVLFARKSQECYKLGNINSARNKGLAAAYLNLSAVISAYVVALLVTALVILSFYYI